MCKKLFLVIFIAVLFFQCKEKKKEKAVISSSADTTTFFPVNTFILEDIKDVQQNPYHIYKISNQHPGSRDSSTVSFEEFANLANIFIEKDITSSNIKPLFHESVFHDLTTKSITINYSTNDSSSNIQNISILLDDRNNKMKRVFIKSSYNKGDSLIIEQDNWKAGKSFKIIKSISMNDKIISENETAVIWNDKSFE